MKKLITSAEACVGDVLQMKLDGGPTDRATVIGKTGKGKVVRLQLEPPPETGVGPVWIEGLASEELILIRRPRPEGKTEADMLQHIESALRSATRVGTLPPGKTFDLTIHQCRVELDPFRDEEALRAVREAIEAHELGKPEVKPQRNESLIDKHMTP